MSRILTITVDFSDGAEMENNLNKAIDELSNAIKRKGLINMTLDGIRSGSLSLMHRVEIKEAYDNKLKELQ